MAATTGTLENYQVGKIEYVSFIQNSFYILETFDE